MGIHGRSPCRVVRVLDLVTLGRECAVLLQHGPPARKRRSLHNKPLYMTAIHGLAYSSALLRRLRALSAICVQLNMPETLEVFRMDDTPASLLLTGTKSLPINFLVPGTLFQYRNDAHVRRASSSQSVTPSSVLFFPPSCSDAAPTRNIRQAKCAMPGDTSIEHMTVLSRASLSGGF